MTRSPRVVFAIAAPVALLLAGALAAPRLLGVGRELPGVVSIARAPDYQDPALLARAWSLPVARTYRDAAVVFQPNASACGPTSVANLLRSLGTAGATVESATAGTGHCPLGVCFGGLTLDDLADVVRKKTGRRVTVLRDLTPEAFRAHLLSTNDPARRYLANFDRGPLFGRSGGHHSPIAGYLADRDLVFVLDVNASYRPWLVPSARLYEAIDTVDRSSGQKRGLLLVE